MPGILQSPFLNRIGGSPRVRSDLAAALAEGRGVTAKIRWLTRADEDGEGEGRPRWIHCTPLLGHSGAVGVWMIILVDEEGGERGATNTGRRFRAAPPVASNIGGKEWDGGRARDGKREHMIAHDKEGERRGGAGRLEREGEYFPTVSRKNSSMTNQLLEQRPGSRPSSRLSSGMLVRNGGREDEFSFQGIR